MSTQAPRRPKPPSHPAPIARKKRTAPATLKKARTRRSTTPAAAPTAPRKKRRALATPSKPKRAARKAPAPVPSPKARTRRNTAPVKRAPRRPADQPRSLLDFQQMFRTSSPTPVVTAGRRCAPARYVAAFAAIS
jgi:hypothetical protein